MSESLSIDTFLAQVELCTEANRLNAQGILPSQLAMLAVIDAAAKGRYTKLNASDSLKLMGEDFLSLSEAFSQMVGKPLRAI